MAGIGFELRRLTARRDFAGWTRAFASAAVISAGPWIISIFSLMALNWLLQEMVRPDELRLFTSSITHVYALALVITGPIQFVLTRYTSDCLSEKRRDAIFPSFLGALLLISIAATALGGAFFILLVPAPAACQVCATALFVHVACIFIASTYLSALREYNLIVFAFFIGYGIGVAGALGLGLRYGLVGAMSGFLAGHSVLFLLLANAVHREFGSGKGSWFGFLRAFFRFPELMLCGLFYNLAIWIDKFLFWWFSQSKVQIAGALRAAPDYDLAIHLSLLSIAPGMAIFFLQVETAFSERYHQFFDAVRNARPLHEISTARHGIILSLRDGFDRLVKVQGLTTALLVVFADRVGALFQIGYVQTGIFRITLFGALLLVVFLAALTVLFYFDDRRGALLCSLVFFSANTILSVATLLKNEAWYGFGFVTAAALALALAAVRLNARLGDLEYHTFTAQGVG